MHGGYHACDVDIDFSVSLNPYSSPEVSELIEDAIKEGIAAADRYPDPDQKDVREAISGAIGVCSDHIVAGNGASELIMAVVRTVAPGKALLIEPGFTGYRYALESLGGCDITQEFLKEENGFAVTDDIISSMREDQDIMFLCDPWNPTGQNIEEELLKRILERADELGITVVLDRSFYMLSDNSHKCTIEKATRWIDQYKNLFIIRSYTKYFSLPGIRMGYAISSPKNVKMLKNRLSEWNLSAISSALMRRLSVFENREIFHKETLDLIKREREFLTDELSKIGYKVFKSDSDFILIKCQKNIYEMLLAGKIAIRKCDDLPGLGDEFFRIAVRSHEDNESLIRALRSYCSERT